MLEYIGSLIVRGFTVEDNNDYVNVGWWKLQINENFS